MKYLLIPLLYYLLFLNLNFKQLDAKPNEISNDEVLIYVSLSDSSFGTDKSLLILEYEITNLSSNTIRISEQFIALKIFNAEQTSIEHCILINGIKRYLNFHLDPSKIFRIKTGDVHHGTIKVDLLSVCFDNDSLLQHKYYYLQLSAYENKKKEFYKSNIVKFQWLESKKTH